MPMFDFSDGNKVTFSVLRDGHTLKSGSVSSLQVCMERVLPDTAVTKRPNIFSCAFLNKCHVTFSSLKQASTVYRKHEPIFFQSLGNPFIFRCIDGVLIDGNDKGLSRSVYRSCSRRDQLGPFQMSDESWLTAAPQNPLAVGQYVNNCSHEKAANVCYQEFDVPGYFPVELKQYLPNIVYSHDIESHPRCVVLVTLRDIKQGEELFSNYYTIVS
ncbi:PREDICTED: SET domain-containing protein 9 [Nipponia nippon]|uniref:SET domain-containing protein 9 n=1 Tax=Nipponia nippon TaxID=128390 RepID=UPI0005116BF3|nr:PREDICTED: SET domain-containing protein 9 [Nipponia nippon]